MLNKNFSKSNIVKLSGKNDQLKEQILVEIVLGRNSAKCKYLGMCKIEKSLTANMYFVNDRKNTENRKIYALAKLINANVFELAFYKHTVSPSNFQKHFSSLVFTMEESFTVSDDILGQPIYIKKGLYKIDMTEEFLIVKFELN